MKRITRIITSLALIAGLCSISCPAYAYDVFGNACGAGGADSAVCQGKANNTTNPLTGPNGTLIKVANLIAIIAGAVAIFVIMIAGWRYITSGGDPSKIQGAKSTLIYALVGLAIIAASDTIIGFVLSKL